jgi:16S rRNA (adenine1518-N6/adenine1519-N6)-dimethyltransferase
VRRAPDSVAAVKAALDDSGAAPLKRFGQNFLVDRRLLDRAAEAASVGPNDVVLEPGPGLGALTERLLETGARVVAVEIDRGLFARLRRAFGDEPRLRLIEGDVLEGRGLNSEALDALPPDEGSPPKTPWRVATNLPYGITGPFLNALLALPGGPPIRTTAMLQKEAVDALLASPGDDAYSTISLASALYFRAERLFVAKPDAFYPRPEVDSCVVALEPKLSDAPPPHDLLPFARKLFQSRRKALRSSLRRSTRATPDAIDAALRFAGLSGDDRVDGVAPEAIARLFSRIRADFEADARKSSR